MAEDTKELLETVLKGVTKSQSDFEAMQKNSATKAELQEFMEKSTEAAQKAAESLQAIQNKEKLYEEKFNDIQKAILSVKGDSNPKNENTKYSKEFDRFLKHNIAISGESIEKEAELICKKSLFGADENDIAMNKKALVEGSNPDGGFFIPVDRSNRILQRIFETSPIRPLVTVSTTTSDEQEFILDDDEVDCGWVGEVDTRDVTATNQIGVLKIPVHEVYAQPKISQHMLDDAGFDVSAWLEGKISFKIARKENTAFVSGNSDQKPKGFTTYDAWTTNGTYKRNAVEQISTATALTVSADDLIGLQGALFQEYQNGAQWAMPRTVFFTKILTLKDDNGNYLINPRLLAEGGSLVLLGDRVNLFADMDGLTSGAFVANTLPIAYANWKEFYTIVDRLGIRVIRDIYTAKPYTKFYTTKRTGGAVTNFEAGKLLSISA